MNQKEFAAKIGISPATLNYYCKQKGMLEGQTGIEPEKCYDWFMKTGRTDMAAKVRKAFKFGAEKKVVIAESDCKHPYCNLIRAFREGKPFKFVLEGTVKKREFIKKIIKDFINPSPFPFPNDKKVYFVVGLTGFLTASSKKAYKECPFPEYFCDTNTLEENKELDDVLELHHSVSMKTDSPMILKEIQHFPEGSTAHPLVVSLDKVEELGRRFESFMVLLRELVGNIK